MDAGRIIGVSIAGSSLLSGLVIGARAVYVKAIGAITPKPGIELPPIVLPPGGPDEER